MKYLLICMMLLWTNLEAIAKFSGKKVQRHKEQTRHFEDHPPEEKETFWDRKYLTGDWWGARAALAAKGVTFGSALVVDSLGNPIGGEERAFKSAGWWGADIRIDLEKYKNWPGWVFYISASYGLGENLSNEIGNDFFVQQAYVNQTFKLVDLYLEKHFSNENGLIRFGRLCAADDFITSALYAEFVSGAFNANPIAVFYNTPFSIFPNATWGGVIAGKAFEKRIEGKLGVYNANEKAFENHYHGFDFSFRNTQGVQFNMEWAYHFLPEHNPKSLEGQYTVGAYYFTGPFDKFPSGTVHGNWAYYFMANQMLYRCGPTSVIPFVAMVFAPKDRNIFPFFVFGGLIVNGPLQSRPHDIIAFGIAYGRYSSELRKSQEARRRAGTGGDDEPQNFETAIDLSYAIQINKWFIFQPDMQVIINPRGIGSIPNALVLGAQMIINF